MTELLVIVACVALNAGLAAVEAAFISVSKAELRAQGRADTPSVKRLLHLRERPERSLSAIQVGITLVGIVSGAVGGARAQEFVSPFLQSLFDLGPGTAKTVAIAIVAVPLMFVTVVLGELVPKAFALRHPEYIALAGARWLVLLERIFLPVVGLLAWATRAVVAVIPRRPFVPTGIEAPAAKVGLQPHYALNLLELAQRRARDAMVPWSAAASADASMTPQAIAEIALASRHTRLPVLQDGEVIGLLHTKELLAFLAAGEVDWRALVRPIVSVGPDDPLLGVLRLLQGRRSHLAIVLSGDRTPLGLVTLEDIFEEVLGDLYDEDDDQAVIQLLAARGKVRGLLPGPSAPGR